MVLHSPMMVTVAKSLDIPIKLVFPRPDAKDPTVITHAMLGLGDVVLPGIMIALALRFDLYMFYLRKQKAITSDDSSPPQTAKARYTSVSNRWGERFWTHSWFGYPLVTPKNDLPHPATTFPKPYFHAALTGYVLGMVTTVIVMQVFDHAQPALLYLVPGVLGSVWGAALVRGEIKEMWHFSEATEDEEEQPGQENRETKKKHSNQSFFSHEKQMRNAAILERRVKAIVDDGADSSEDESQDKSNSGSAQAAQKAQRILSHSRSHEFFSFSIEAPFKLKQPDQTKSTGSKKASAGGNSDAQSTSTESENVPKSTVDSKGQPKEKRARIE
jgi:minor histocompatibility antigen H13